MSEAPPDPATIRMRGFTQRAPVEVVWDWLAEQVTPLGAETVPLARAHGRVLAQDLQAPEPVPPFRRAAMDGYALHGEETVGASAYNPLPLRLLGESFPGAPFPGSVPKGACVRIMTGAPVPEGADAVLPAEHARESGERVEVSDTVPGLKHVGPVGEDIEEGEVLLREGHRLRPQDVGLIASLGRDRVAVVGRPRIRIVVTGNELAVPGAGRGPAQIFDANTDMLKGLLARDGGVLEAAYRVGDDPQAIQERLTADGADVVIVTGGSSVGAEDHAPALLAECGELAFHGVAMRPSAPTGIGRLGAAPVFLLPGNPVSCLAGHELFAGRAVRLRAGRDPDFPNATVRLPLTRKLVSALGRLDYSRVRLGPEGAEPLAVSGASILSSTTRADGFVLVPPDSEGYPPGTEVTVRLYEPACAPEDPA